MLVLFDLLCECFWYKIISFSSIWNIEYKRNEGIFPWTEYSIDEYIGDGYMDCWCWFADDMNLFKTYS